MTHSAISAGQTPEGWLTDSWYLISASRDLNPGTQRRIMLLGQPVMIGRTGTGAAFALRDICPHRLVPLSAGRQIETNGEPTVECPYHGWRFGTDGVCRYVPSLLTDDPFDPSKVKVRAYPVHEANGAVFAYVADNPRSTDPPVVPPPEFGPLPEKPRLTLSKTLSLPMDDAVITCMDSAQPPLIERQWWWTTTGYAREQADHKAKPLMQDWSDSQVLLTKQSLLQKLIFGCEMRTDIRYCRPGLRLEIHKGERATFTSLIALTPQDTSTTRLTQLAYWSGSPLLRVLQPSFRP